MTHVLDSAPGGMEKVQFTATPTPEFTQILTPEAVGFVVDLVRRFGAQRLLLLEARTRRQLTINAGILPDFLLETAHIREADWQVGAIPEDLLDRRVEITGPTDRKMVINALNSGAKVFMADFEDAHAPTWDTTLQGQINLRDAINRTLVYQSPEGKDYRLGEQLAVLMVRPRGWHLNEKHMLVDGRQVSGSLFDFGLFLFHNAKRLLEQGTGPYFYIPKLESHLEARLWNQVFDYAEQALGLPKGCIKCTVLIETILAAFEMDEILYELKHHIVALNCGRWDYIFSFIKRFHANPEWVLPDRAQVTMLVHFLRSYSRLLIRTCHRRRAFAMGGMAAQIPIKEDPEADAVAKAKVRADKEREAGDGHDGTWVAHPGLVPVAMEVFDRVMPMPNQLDRQLPELSITAQDLLQLPEGTITATGVRNNISAALRYMTSWLGGRGAVPIHNLMEDAATAEIARAQLWQWIRHPKGVLEDGRKVTAEMVKGFLDQELAAIGAETGAAGEVWQQAQRAAALLEDIVTRQDFVEFLTLPAYEELP